MERNYFLIPAFNGVGTASDGCQSLQLIKIIVKGRKEAGAAPELCRNSAAQNSPITRNVMERDFALPLGFVSLSSKKRFLWIDSHWECSV